MTKFFTRTGDDGTTSLLGEGRARKDAPRLETVGTLDEVNAVLGLARSVCQTRQSIDLLLTVQRDLYSLMAEVASTPENADRFRSIDSSRVIWLENQITTLERTVPSTNEFIVPGDSFSGAVLDLARTVTRRAERRLTSLHLAGEVENPDLLRYLNRLSSLCFVLELLENQQAGSENPTLAKG